MTETRSDVGMATGDDRAHFNLGHGCSWKQPKGILGE